MGIFKRSMRLVCLISFFLSLSFAFAQDTTGVGSLSGVVTQEPAATPVGARVCLPSLNRCADADSTGMFRITDVRAGTYELQITAPPRLAIRRAGIEVRAGLETRLEVALPALEEQRQEVVLFFHNFTFNFIIKLSTVLPLLGTKRNGGKGNRHLA